MGVGGRCYNATCARQVKISQAEPALGESLLPHAHHPCHRASTQAECALLKARLEAMLHEEKDPRGVGDPAIFDTYKHLGNRKTKGYAEWEARQKGIPLPEAPRKGKKDNRNLEE